MIEYHYIVMNGCERCGKEFDTEKEARKYIGNRVTDIWMEKHGQGYCIDARDVAREFRILVVRSETNPVYFNGKDFGEPKTVEIVKTIDWRHPS